MKKVILLTAIAIATALAGCVGKSGSDQTIDLNPNLLTAAQEKISTNQFDEAIKILTTDLSSAYQTRTDSKEALASAYLGKCGLSATEIEVAIKDSSNIMTSSLAALAGKTIDSSYCDLARETITSIGPAVSRTNAQNLILAKIGIVQAAVTVSSKMDADKNGSVDVGWNTCVASTNPNHLSDDEVDKIATGLSLAFENQMILNSVLNQSGNNALYFSKTTCAAPTTLPVIGQPADYGAPGGVWTDYGLPLSPVWTDFGIPTSIVQPFSCVSISAPLDSRTRDKVRRMLSSTQVGFGSCDLSDTSASVDTGANPPTASFFQSCCPNLAP